VSGDLAQKALGQLPESLRQELSTAFNAIVTNYGQGRWEPSELNGGKLCEVVYSILRGHVDGSYPARASKPRNMLDACKALEQNSGQPRPIRIQIPRVLVALYEIRNNRGVGHVGGDVDPNHMDAVLVLEMAKWLMAELVRIFHDVDIATATAVVDAIVERTVPIIWEVGGQRRVLDPTLTQRDRTLLLLYASAGSVDETDLISWIEARSPSAYRRDVLRKLHRERLVEYHAATNTVRISPLGLDYVESNLPLTVGH
jgi:hypothetical protein